MHLILWGQRQDRYSVIPSLSLLVPFFFTRCREQVAISPMSLLQLYDLVHLEMGFGCEMAYQEAGSGGLSECWGLYRELPRVKEPYRPKYNVRHFCHLLLELF